MLRFLAENPLDTWRRWLPHTAAHTSLLWKSSASLVPGSMLGAFQPSL